MSFILLLLIATAANGYFLVAMENALTQQRVDPIVSPGKVAGHVHTVLGGSNFGLTTNTSHLRQSQCTSTPIVQDKSNYWFPSLYFQWRNGSFSSVGGGAVLYYLFDDQPGKTTAFPDDFRMISGNPLLRTYNASSFAQQAVTFLCLDFAGNSTRHNGFPSSSCPSGVRAQLNFPSCWNGKDVDSPDHKSHVAFRAGGPDIGDCTDPKFPVTLPRIFMEVYLDTSSWEKHRPDAMNSTQPFVYSMGDRTGYGYHGDFMNGWDKGVLQNVVDKCHCNPFGDPTCCKDAGLFDLKATGQDCFISNTVDEKTLGTIDKLPGNNPIQPEGRIAMTMNDTSQPPLITTPVRIYTDLDSAMKANLVARSSIDTAPSGAGAPEVSLSNSRMTRSMRSHFQRRAALGRLVRTSRSSHHDTRL